jgi:hypothetical protein
MKPHGYGYTSLHELGVALRQSLIKHNTGQRFQRDEEEQILEQ